MSADANGLIGKRLPEIIADIQGRQVEKGFNFDYQDNKVIYQLNAVIGATAAEIYELMQIIYDSTKLEAAEGVWLDSLALLRGVTRIPAQVSFTTQQAVTLGPSDTVPANSSWSGDNTPHKARNPFSVSGSLSENYETSLLFLSDIDTQTSGITYSISVNAVTYSYVSQAGDTSEDVVNGVLSDITADPNTTFSSWKIATTAEGTGLLMSPDAGTSLSVSIGNTLISVVTTKVYTRLELTEYGAIDVPTGFIDTLDTPIGAPVTTQNEVEFVLGREQEKDSELRLRVAQGPITDCTGTVLSIEASLLSTVPGVSRVLVVQNVTGFPTDGDPILPSPGSDPGFVGFPDGVRYGGYQVLVVGGEEEAVAQEVWRTSPATAPLFGNTQRVITDSSGTPRIVHYSRPEEVHLAYEVEYTRYNEEDFPTNGAIGVRDATVSYTNSLGLDNEVINGRVKCAIRDAVPLGIETLTVRVQRIDSPGTAPDPGDWQTTTYPINATQFPSTTDQDVVVIDAT